jgi:VanZ family protein
MLTKWLFYGYTVLVVVLSVIPFSGIVQEPMNETHVVTIRLDYLVHSAVFFVWGLIGWWYCKKTAKRLSLLFEVGVVMAVGTEYAQRWIPWRGYNVNDVIGNVSGVLLAYVVIFASHRFQNNRTRI